MVRSGKGSWARESGETARAEGAVSFGMKHARSEAFRALFKEGMTLVELSAAYLDGPGRVQSKGLRRPVALAYATESMRLTTRLMQVASWLLLRRAVAEGELTPAQALTEKHRVRLSRQEISCAPEILDELPPVFADLCARSMRLQARVLHLDASIAEPRERPPVAAPGAVAAQVELLRAAFARPGQLRAG
jgi:regulator of CtrA degradation